MENVYTNNAGQTFIILQKEGKKCLIKFLETGYVRSALYENLIVGKVRDLYAVASYGVGYDGEFKKVHYWKQAKQLWRNMLKRCYCEKDQKGYFGKCEVDVRWHCFANFLEDLPHLKNFDLWLKGQNTNSDKYNLDKDLICKGNTIYSRDLCCFITEYENKSEGAKNGKPFTKKAKMG